MSNRPIPPKPPKPLVTSKRMKRANTVPIANWQNPQLLATEFPALPTEDTPHS